MPFNYRKELKDLDDAAQQRVVEIYEKADRIMQERMQKTLDSEITKATVDQTIAFNEQVMRAALGQTKKPIEDTVKNAYLLGADAVQDAAPNATVGVTFEQLSVAEKEQINALMQESYLRFAETLRVVTTASRNVLNQAFRRQVREKISTGILLGDSIDQIARELRNEIFTPQGITAFVKRNGARMSLKDYSRTLTRTMVISSANEGSATRMANLGLTIFQISSHAGGAEDEACASQQGKIYDTTGKKYPKPAEEDRPPYHPNCRHVINARPDLQF